MRGVLSGNPMLTALKMAPMKPNVTRLKREPMMKVRNQKVKRREWFHIR